MEHQTEWDIAGGNFNKPVEFPETIKGEHGNCFNQKATDQLNQLRIELGFSNNPR